MESSQCTRFVFDENLERFFRATVVARYPRDQQDLAISAVSLTGLNPFTQEIQFFERDEAIVPYVGVEGLRCIAERSGEYRGQSPVRWFGEDDSDGSDIWTGPGLPYAAKVIVYRLDGEFEGIAKFEEFADTYDGVLQGFWRKMPEHMIAIRAECFAFQAAFPELLEEIEVGGASL